MTRVGRVPVDSTSEAEGKATLTGSLVNVYPYGLWMAQEWGSRPELVRSAWRSWCAPTLRTHHNGFRVARTLTP